jgi:hypothetical protein
MRLEERVASALKSQTESLPPVRTDLSAIRSAARAQSLRRAAVGVMSAVVVAAVVAAAGVTGAGRDRSADVPGGSTSASPTPSATDTTGPIDTANWWRTYTSPEYGFEVGRPPGWTVQAATRPWRADKDQKKFLSRGYDTFRSGPGDVAAGVWSAPLEPGTRIESTADIADWVEDYCVAEGRSACTGIQERGVPLCLEKWDCHPGLLVQFGTDVRAFFSGGIYDADAMTVVAVWRPEDDSSVEAYGGARRLLEGFLSTMQVWPASTPVDERR